VTIPVEYKRILERWQNVVKVALQNTSKVYPEANLQSDLAAFIFQELGFEFDRIKQNHQIGSGLKADMVIYKDLNQPPIMVVENKRLELKLARTKIEDFDKKCRQDSLYKKAIGCASIQDNGIKQYLNVESVNPDCLATYGLVFNGIFFQLWRRVDGLVLPLTLIQKVTPTSLPKLLDQLQYCFDFPKRALVTAIWNQKGGVAKTTNTINVGATLALESKRVLLIDLDPQADITNGLIENGKNSKSLLTHQKFLKKSLTYFLTEDWPNFGLTISKNIKKCCYPTNTGKTYEIFVLTSEREELKGFNRSQASTNQLGKEDENDFSGFTQSQKLKFFRKLIDLVAQSYDYIFIDTGPSPDTLSLCMLNACDTVLIPVDYGRKSLQHSILASEYIPAWRDRREEQNMLPLGPWNLGVVFSNCPSPKGKILNSYIEKELNNNKYIKKVYSTEIKIYAKTKEAEYKRAPVICWQGEKITKMYQELVNEIFLKHNFIDS
jgi:chromosome partitioning protein